MATNEEVFRQIDRELDLERWRVAMHQRVDALIAALKAVEDAEAAAVEATEAAQDSDAVSHAHEMVWQARRALTRLLISISDPSGGDQLAALRAILH